MNQLSNDAKSYMNKCQSWWKKEQMHSSSLKWEIHVGLWFNGNHNLPSSHECVCVFVCVCVPLCVLLVTSGTPPPFYNPPPRINYQIDSFPSCVSPLLQTSLSFSMPCLLNPSIPSALSEWKSKLWDVLNNQCHSWRWHCVYLFSCSKCGRVASIGHYFHHKDLPP